MLFSSFLTLDEQDELVCSLGGLVLGLQPRSGYLKPLLSGHGLRGVGKPAGATGHQPGRAHVAVDVPHG